MLAVYLICQIKIGEYTCLIVIEMKQLNRQYMTKCGLLALADCCFKLEV